MKTRNKLTAAILLFAMLLSVFGGSLAGAYGQPVNVTVADGELACAPLAQDAVLVYEGHEAGYAVSLVPAGDGVTMDLTAVPGDEAGRAQENARLYVCTGVALKPGTTYRVSYSLWAEKAQAEYTVCFDGAGAEGAFGALSGRSVAAGGTDRVQYQIAPQADQGELVLRLLLGKTGDAGNSFRLSGLAVEEVSIGEVGQNAVLVDNLNYNASGVIRAWANSDSGAVLTCTDDSATLKVTKTAPPAENEDEEGIEVWKIKMFVATGLKPAAGKVYHLTADIDTTSTDEIEICYNEGNTEKGYGVEYGQHMAYGKQTLDRLVYVPQDRTDPGELVVQFSLGKLRVGDTFTISNVFLEEAETAKYSANLLPADFTFKNATEVWTVEADKKETGTATDVTQPISWDARASVSKSGDNVGNLSTLGSKITLDVNGGKAVWHARLNIDTGETLLAGTTYSVSFNIQSDKGYSGASYKDGNDDRKEEFEVLYGTGYKDNGIDNNEAYGARKGLTVGARTPKAMTFTVTPKEDGPLLVSLLLGSVNGKMNTVTVSDLKIEKVVVGAPTGDNLAQVSYPAEATSVDPTPAPTADPSNVTSAGSFELRGFDGDYRGKLSGAAGSVTVTCAGTTGGYWERGLFINNICTLETGHKYTVTFKLQGPTDMEYEVTYDRDDHFGSYEINEKGFDAEYGKKATGGVDTVTHTIDLTGTSSLKSKDGGKLMINVQLGKAATGAQVTVSDVKVVDVDDAQGSDLADVTYFESDPSTPTPTSAPTATAAPTTAPGATAAPTAAPTATPTPGHFEMRGFDGDYRGTLSGDASSVTMTCSGTTGGGYWERGLFINDICALETGNKYTVTFKLQGPTDMEYEVTYDRDDHFGTYEINEKGFDAEYGKKATGGVDTVTHTIDLTGTSSLKSKDGGKLMINVQLGKAAAGAQVTVSEVKVVDVDDAQETNLANLVYFAQSSDPVPTATAVPTATPTPGRFEMRGFDGDYRGTLSGDETSVTMTCSGTTGGGYWERGLFINDICTLETGNKYIVTFKLQGPTDMEYEVTYDRDDHFGSYEINEKGFDAEYGKKATGGVDTVTHTIDLTGTSSLKSKDGGKLMINVQLGKAAAGAQVTVSDVKVVKVGEEETNLANLVYFTEPSGASLLAISARAASMARAAAAGRATIASRYATAVLAEVSARAGSSFRVRVNGSNGGTLEGDGASYALMTCTGAAASADAWKRGLFIDNICTLTAGESYQVTFDIEFSATPTMNCPVVFSKDGHFDASEGVYGREYIEKGADGDYPLTRTVTHTITASDTGMLNILIGDLGNMAEGATVKVSNLAVRKLGSEMVPVASVGGFGSVWTEVDGAYTAELVRNEDGATFAVTQAPESTSDKCKSYNAKLFVRTGVIPESNKYYRVSFKIKADKAQKKTDYLYNGAEVKGYGGEYEIALAAGEETVVSHVINAGPSNGEIVLQMELGQIDQTEGNTFTVSDVKVEQVRFNVAPGYKNRLTTTRDSASLRITDAPIGGAGPFDDDEWKVKMFVHTGFHAVADETYRVTFDLAAAEDMKTKACYNRDDVESDYGTVEGIYITAGEKRTVEHVFKPEKDKGGELILQFMLGGVPADNRFQVSKLKIERVLDYYSGESALPAPIVYRAPGAVDYWAHEDYTVNFNGTGDAITANIVGAPARGAEPWKIKLFLDTAVVLQPGKYYKVTANVTGKSAQDFEICYNNGGKEMGYDSLGGLHLTAGQMLTAEKVISVPAGKTDCSNLMLQFNLGKTTNPNDVTVSGVKVEEVSLAYTNVMPAGFTYTEGSTIDTWTNPDYTTAVDALGDKAVFHIVQPPATGAEVWKAKLLVHTGAMLSAGKTYLVRADLLADKSQGYEVCFNNEETEKGFDVLYGQSITGGVKKVVEKTIAVPADMTDAGELVIQFSVGGGVVNDFTVSNVSVQELAFGAGSQSLTPDTVIGLTGSAGGLGVTREKVSWTAAGPDGALTVAGARLRAGDPCTVVFTAKADKAVTGTLTLRRTGDKAVVLAQPVALTAQAQTFTLTTPAPLDKAGVYELVWQLDEAAQAEVSGIALSYPGETLSILHAVQNVSINGKPVDADTYNINNGNNYIKLRDLAMLLNDTEAQMAVRYNNKSNTISLTSGKLYSPVGGELTIGEDLSACCARSSQDLTVNGSAVNLKAYNFGGYNFFRIRDLSELLGFDVDYIPETETVAIRSPLTPEALEKNYAYDLFFLPEIDGESQPYVGDTMPYYEDGTYYIYYLKDGGDAYNHSVYLATTKDFVTYTEYDAPVLNASREDVQDSWIGTGSVTKIDGEYYFFYTGFNSSGSQEYHEKVMVAKSSTPTGTFEKVAGWAITPPAELGQKNDFRDPQAYYDPATGTISLTITAGMDGRARILKYTLSKDLSRVNYDGVIFTDPTGDFWNMECSDTFKLGNKWYLTYSGQDDTLWYAMADSRFGPYAAPVRMEGKIFYAAKHVEDGKNSYMVGWARKGNSPSSTEEVAGWAGNMAVQKLAQRADGSLYLTPVDAIVADFAAGTAVELESTAATVTAGAQRGYQQVFTSAERFMLQGEFTATGEGAFGLAFDFNGKPENNKLISLDPKAGKLSLVFNEGKTPITETKVALQPNQKYSFTYIQDGAIGMFYVDGQAALTVRLYGVTGKPVSLFAENNSVTFTSLKEYTR